MGRTKTLILVVLSGGVGFLLGASSISRPIPNAPIELPVARSPLNPKDVMGLIGSIGIRTLAGRLGYVPFVVLETERTFVLSVPTSKNEVHYVLVPKKDIRDPGQLSAEDQPYLVDIFLTARGLIEKEGLVDYRIYANGRGRQRVSYMHFHLVGRKGHQTVRDSAQQNAPADTTSPGPGR
jgi:diadenosine tetraphosphate (Ap4A) HIT family hydrolase